jgi:hypothetical protein
VAPARVRDAAEGSTRGRWAAFECGVGVEVTVAIPLVQHLSVQAAGGAHASIIPRVLRLTLDIRRLGVTLIAIDAAAGGPAVVAMRLAVLSSAAAGRLYG